MTETQSTQEHEHFTYRYEAGRKVALWSTKDECVVCGSGRDFFQGTADRTRRI